MITMDFNRRDEGDGLVNEAISYPLWEVQLVDVEFLWREELREKNYWEFG